MGGATRPPKLAERRWKGGSDTHHALNNIHKLRKPLTPSCALSGVRTKRRLPEPLQRICPTGKSANSCPAPERKIFRFPRRANQHYQARRPVPLGGGHATALQW